jgi:hypothetical protein
MVKGVQADSNPPARLFDYDGWMNRLSPSQLAWLEPLPELQ